MDKRRTELVTKIRRYASELERLGAPVERIVLYGSQLRDEARPDSDIDLAVFSEAFGGPDHLEFSGILSKAKRHTEPMIEAMGFHPSVLASIPPISFLHEILQTGEIVYQRSRRKAA